MKYDTYLLAAVLSASIALSGCGNSFSVGNTVQTSSARQSQLTVAKRTTSKLSASFWPQEIAFVSRNLGYLSGTIPFHGSTVARLYMTTNGGRTWTLAFHGGVSIPSLAALGKHVWIDVVKTFSYPVKGELFASTTGGKVFRPLSSRSLTNMTFTRVDLGWGVASSSAIGPKTLVITRNGGRDWKPVTNVLTFKNGALGEPQSIGFADTQHGLLLETGEPSAGFEPKVLLRTTNGIAVAPSAPDDAWIWETYGLLLHTTDGGTHWAHAGI